MHINVFFACVAEYIMAIAKEITVVEEMTKFNGCYQNWMTTYAQFSSTFSIEIIVIIVASMTTILTHYFYNQICN
jgi:hypothetical protein